MDELSKHNQFKQAKPYTDERLSIHQDIIKNLTEGLSPAHNQPLAIFLGGGSASGKSSISKLLIQSFKEDNESVMIIDSDEIKARLPEYAQLQQQDPKKTASILHDESSDISEKLYAKCLDDKVNLIFDGTMKNTEKYTRFIDQAKSLGYQVSGVVVDVSLEEAYRRAERRFETKGRLVPAEIIKQSHELVPVTFYEIKDKLDSFYLYDTSERHPEQFYVKDKEQIRIKNEERLNQFYEKGDFSVDNWIKLEKTSELKDILKEGKGMPTGEDVTSNLLKQHVKSYKFENVNGIESLHYKLQDGKMGKIPLERIPYLSQEKKNQLIDQASHTLPIPKTPIKGLEM